MLIAIKEIKKRKLEKESIGVSDVFKEYFIWEYNIAVATQGVRTSHEKMEGHTFQLGKQTKTTCMSRS